MQPRLLGLVEIFDDGGAFEQNLVSHLEQRNLAQRRDRLEPVRLVGEIDVDALERRALLGEHDRRALHIGAEIEGNERQLCRHGLLQRLNWMRLHLN